MAMPSRLTHQADLEALASPDGYISICGYGSLLSERSARTTFPNLANYRIARLTGFRRLFTVTGGFFFAHHVANIKTQEIAALSVEPCEGEIIAVAVFEIKKTEIPAFIEREREYRFLAVVPESLDAKPFTNPARAGKNILNNTENIRSIRFGGMMFYHAVLLAAKSLGDEVYNNFLDHTFLADRKTTIRQYLENVGANIMEEEPPESLKTRYGASGTRVTLANFEWNGGGKRQNKRSCFLLQDILIN
ncbi:hypothetical protein CR513_22915, partial [Mucuna pruriens]